jgi:hypothetical protein
MPAPSSSPKSLEEAINRHDAAALAVGFVKSRQLPYRLALGVDRLAPTCWVLAPVGDQAPAQRVQRDLPGLMIAADDQQLLAGGRVTRLSRTFMPSTMA